LSVRHDTFEMTREAGPDIDRGHAWTWAYHYQPTPKLGVALEWLAIDSTRDMHWGYFYGLPAQAAERQWRLQLSYRLRSTDTTSTARFDGPFGRRSHPQFLWIKMWKRL
jgi:hypothetical protein